MEYNMYLIFVVVTALIVLTIIIVKEVKKRDRRDLVIAYLPRSYGKYLSIFVSYFLFAYFNVNYFVKNMKELYTKLSPKYVDSIYKLLDPEILDSIANRLLNTGEDTLAIQTFRLAGKSSNFYTGLLLIIIGIYYLYTWISRDEIWEEGIYNDGSTLFWEKIKDYKWEKETKEKNGEIITKYYKLNLGVYKSKIGKAISDEDTNPLTLKVYEDDKEKVDDFLSEKIIQS